METKDFLDKYLWPSGNKLDPAYTHKVPKIEGLRKSADFIVQSEVKDTFSTNIITKYVSDTLGVRLIDVSKNSQNKVSGLFVRLVGTMCIVKKGYPFLMLDAPISNVSLRISETVELAKVEDIATTVFILLPQASSEQRKIFSDSINKLAKGAGIALGSRDVTQLNAFWGTAWMAQSKAIDLDIIQKLRDIAWDSYKRIIDETKAKLPFDYRPFQEHLIFDTAQRESGSFKSKGLDVPEEAQAAFFSVMVSDVE
jgi:hypothetical protein